MPLRPKLFSTLKDYSIRQFAADAAAGVIVGIVAIPLAIAFGIASGVSPERGLFTAIVAGFLVSVLGGSRVQIGGPTGAFVVIVYDIVQRYGTDGLVIATFLAGVMLVVAGVLRMGAVIKFVPRPVTVGFTSGIAVIIFSSQIKDLFGLDMGAIPAHFIEKIAAYAEHSGGVNLPALVIGVGTVSFLAVWQRFFRAIPGSLVAIVASAAAVQALGLPVETIGSRFGDLPRALPSPSLPSIDWLRIGDLIQPAFTIALLGGIESLLSAVVADGMIGSRHRSNMELVAQGVANVGSAVFGGIPATGAIARTATNVKSGGRTPVAGIIHAITVAAILLFFAPWAKMIPLACLAGILVNVSYHMSEWRSFRSLLRGPRSDVAVLVLTFLLTVLVDLTVAIQIGMVLAAFAFMRRMAGVTEFRVLESEAEDEYNDRETARRIPVPKGVEVFEISGPLFFGVTQEFEETMRIVSKKPKVRILNMKDVPFIDATALHSLRQFHERCRRDRIRLLVAGVRPRPAAVLRQSGLEAEIGRENFFNTLDHAVQAASPA